MEAIIGPGSATLKSPMARVLTARSTPYELTSRGSAVRVRLTAQPIRSTVDAGTKRGGHESD